MATTTPRPRAAAAIAGIQPLGETAVVRDFEPGAGEQAGAARPGPHGEGWVDVGVPGDVHTALVEAGRIEDPFYDRNEDAVTWMEEREWWYRIAFAGPEAPADGRAAAAGPARRSTRSRPSSSTAPSSAATRTCSARRPST